MLTQQTNRWEGSVRHSSVAKGSPHSTSRGTLENTLFNKKGILLESYFKSRFVTLSERNVLKIKEQDDKGSLPVPIVQFFKTLFKRPLTPPPSF